MICTPFYSGQGCGNQLANYVAVRTLALDKGYKFGVAQPNLFKGKYFMNLDMGEPVGCFMSQKEGEKPFLMPEGIDKWYKEKTSDYDPDFFKITDNTMVHGNLQGVNYFKHRKDEVREWLKVDPLDMPDDLCVINFRGGEYKGVKDFFLPIDYFYDAMEEILKINPDMIFQVHTDDAESADEYFPDMEIIQDIGLNWRSIRYAKYLILSNSSFAILPAYLNTDVKKVIAPWGFGRYNTGRWLLEQNYVPEWTWIKKHEN